MLRLIQTANSIPFSFIVDPSAEFSAGQLGQLGLMGNQPVCGVSDGTVPIGVIDDIKTKAFTSNSVNEIVISPPIPAVQQGSQLVSAYDTSVMLSNPNVVASSFMSNPVSCELIPRNGVVVFLAGTPLNFSSTGSGTPDSIRTVVSYTYQIPNVPGEDSTIASGRVTIWFTRMIAQTDQFDTTCRYPINATLFCNEKGLFTTKQIGADYPGIALVIEPPSAINPALTFLLL